MKKLIFFLAIIFVLFTSQSVSAQTASTSSSTTSLKLRISDLNLMKDRYDATVERLNLINGLIVSRTQKLKSAIGTTTGQVQKNIDETRLKINSAKESLKKINIGVLELEHLASSTPNFLSSSTSSTTKAYRERIKEIKKMTKESEKKMKEIFDSMVKSLEILKKIEKHSTTTSATTTAKKFND